MGKIDKTLITYLKMKNALLMSRFYQCLFVISCFLLVLGCKKDKLPEPTQSGAKTFGCKINGKSWIPNGIPGIPTIDPVNGGYDAMPRYAVNIRTYKKRGGSDETITIYLNNVTQPGSYSLNYDTGYYPQALIAENHATYTSPEGYFGTTAKIGGTVSISRADTVAKIISGTFYFNAVNKEGKQVKITSGRFDVTNY
jgi:hypothetical protein